MLLTIFSRLLARLIPLVLALCVVIPAMGKRPPESSAAWEQFGFAYCTLPCFVGITPGVTPFAGISQRLMQYIPSIDPRMINSGSAINFWARMPTQQFAGLMRYNAGLVGEMRFNVLLPVQAVLGELGTPDCILPNANGEPDRLTVIFWERDKVSIGAVLSPDERTINLSANTMALWLRIASPGDCSLRGAQPWRGFAPLWDYTG